MGVALSVAMSVFVYFAKRCFVLVSAVVVVVVDDVVACVVDGAGENLAEGSEAWLVRDKLIAKRDRRIQRRLINLGSKSIQDKIDQVFEGKRR